MQPTDVSSHTNVCSNHKTQNTDLSIRRLNLPPLPSDSCCFWFTVFVAMFVIIMACHILYCNDAKEGFGGITPPKLNRGGWNSARTKYFEGNVVCKNLGAIGSGAAEGRRKTSLGDPKKLDFFFCPHNHARSHPLPVGRFSRNFR